MLEQIEMPHMGGNTFSHRIITALLKEMKNGEYKDSTHLPPELELAQKYNVSRSVIRDALATLEREGFVERGRGIGTVINRNVLNIQNRMDIKHEYLRLVSRMGYLPKTDSIKLYTKKVDKTLADKLQIAINDEVIVCEKRVLANGMPVIFSVDHLPKKMFKNQKYEQYDWSDPIFDILEQKLGINVDADITNLSATNATPEIREKLKLDETKALLLMDEIGYYKLNKPILHSYSYYTDFFDFSLLRKRV